MLKWYRMLVILLATFLFLPATLQAPSYGYHAGEGFYRKMFAGDSFCRNIIKAPSDRCCHERDDACSVSDPRFQGTVCYCDKFCDRHQPDCCPDYFDVCHGESQTCRHGEFQCTFSNQCIQAHQECDGNVDCRDGTDERPHNQRCHPQACKHHEFQCLSTYECIPESKKCDSRPDCSDGSDEYHTVCPAPTIEPGSVSFGIQPDVVHLGKYPQSTNSLPFTCSLKVENHRYKLKLEMWTDPEEGRPRQETGWKSTVNLERNMTIGPNTKFVRCRAIDRHGVEKLTANAAIRKQKNCVRVRNETPLSIVASLRYTDDYGNEQKKQGSIKPSHSHAFLKDRTLDSHSTLEVQDEDKKLQAVAVLVYETSGTDCVVRRVTLDESTARLYITG